MAPVLRDDALPLRKLTVRTIHQMTRQAMKVEHEDCQDTISQQDPHYIHLRPRTGLSSLAGSTQACLLGIS